MTQQIFNNANSTAQLRASLRAALATGDFPRLRAGSLQETGGSRSLSVGAGERLLSGVSAAEPTARSNRR